MADICGPFTLDQLDQFGKIDALNITLDSPIWQSPDTCVLLSSGAVSAFATVIGLSDRIRLSSASVTGVASGSLSATAAFVASALANANANILGNPTKVTLSSGSTIGTASANVTANITYFGEANSFAFATTEAIAWAVYDASGSITGVAFVSADGGVIGEEWSLVPADANTWNELVSGNDVWVAVPEGTNTWLLRG